MRGLLALPFVLAVAIALPWLARASLRATAHGTELPSARALAWQSMMLQAVLFALAVLAAWASGIEVAWIGSFSWSVALLGVGTLGFGLALAACDARWPSSRPQPLRQHLRHVRTRDPTWIGAISLAAVAEEYCYRGVLAVLLGTAIGPWPAAVASAALFGAAHLGHGARAAASSAVFGFALQVLCHVHGGLLAAVVVHFLYDLAVSLWAEHRTALGSDRPA